MAVVATRPAVAITATKIAENTSADVGGVSSSDWGATTFRIKNMTAAAAAVFLGGDNTVTAGNGFQWDPADGTLTVELESGEALWGIAAAVTQTLHVLRQGR